MMKKLLISTLFVTTLTLSGYAQSLIVPQPAEGGFENTSGTTFTGSTWTAVGADVTSRQYVGAPYNIVNSAPGGTTFAAFNSGNTGGLGTLTHSFNVAPAAAGAAFTLDFLFGSYGAAGVLQTLNVSVFDSGSNPIPLSQSVFSATNAAFTQDFNTIFTAQSVTFNASVLTGAYTVVFADALVHGLDGSDLVLDNVAITGPPTVPELNASASMMPFALFLSVAACFFGRRRRDCSLIS